jgi:hypothetical protein
MAIAVKTCQTPCPHLGRGNFPALSKFQAIKAKANITSEAIKKPSKREAWFLYLLQSTRA